MAICLSGRFCTSRSGEVANGSASDAGGSLSDENFDTYVEDTLGEAVFEGAFSWLANSLPCFESTDPLPCNMTPGAEGQRPSLWVQEGHPLFEAQQDGISFDTLLDIYEKTGSDLRPHLSDA